MKDIHVKFCTNRNNVNAQCMLRAHKYSWMVLYTALQAWAFLKPVQAKIVPDYYNVIKFPMDLQTVRDVSFCSQSFPSVY